MCSRLYNAKLVNVQMNDFTHFTLVKIFTNTCPFVFGGNMCLRLCTAVIFYTSMRLSGPKWGKTGKKGQGKVLPAT